MFALILGTSIGRAQRVMHADDAVPSANSLASLLQRISGLPVEYKADMVFAIIDAAPGMLSPTRRRALLDDVFRSAASAHYAYIVVEATGNAHGDTVTHGTTSMLGRLKVDALDIQTRAIQEALPSTPHFAMTLFEELNLPEVHATCKDPTVEEVSAFYITAAQVIEDKRIRVVRKQHRDLYLQNLASNVRVAAQIPPFATLLTRVSLSSQELRGVVSALVASLSTITASDREMTAAEEGQHLTDAIKSLSTRLTASEISPQPLLAAYRGFLLRSLTEERCSDHSLDRAQMARSFNVLVSGATFQSSSAMSPLSAASLSPKSAGASASYETIPLNQQVMSKMQRIMAAHQARVAEEYRSGAPGTITPETSDVEDVLRYTTSLGSSGDACYVCSFYEKCTLAMMLKDILPPGDELERAINAEVDYLSFNAMEKDNPVAWLAYFKELINSSRAPEPDATAAVTSEVDKKRTPWGLPNPEATMIRNTLRKSGDPIIAVYMSADDLLHFPYEPLVPTGVR